MPGTLSRAAAIVGAAEAKEIGYPETPKTAVQLHVEAIKAVLGEAVEAGGSSISDYAGADGALGYFQHSFRVYGREGEPCPDGCTGVVERIVQGGRSTFYCPRCQT